MKTPHPFDVLSPFWEFVAIVNQAFVTIRRTTIKHLKEVLQYLLCDLLLSNDYTNCLRGKIRDKNRPEFSIFEQFSLSDLFTTPPTFSAFFQSVFLI